jgi:hypothetical protein
LDYLLESLECASTTQCSFNLPHPSLLPPSPSEPEYTPLDILPLPLSASSAPTLHHLVVATKAKPGLDLLLLSARRYGYATNVLGVTDARPIGHHTTTLCLFDCPPAFGLKMTLVKEAVELLPPTDWVLFTDAYDVIFSRPAHDLLAALEDWEAAAPPGVDLLFGGEKFEWPDENLPGYAARGSADYPFLNSGVYAGRASAVLAAVSSGYDISTNDQRFFTEMLVGSQAKPRAPTQTHLVLDKHQSIFANFAGTSVGTDWVIEGTRILFINKEAAATTATTTTTVTPPPPTRALPAVLHFNSVGKKHMFSVISAVLGPAGAAIADAAQFDGNEIRELFLQPAKTALLSPLPRFVRAMLVKARLGDAAAIAIAILLTFILCFVTGCSKHLSRLLPSQRRIIDSATTEKWSA